jgi:hypothetical protein
VERSFIRRSAPIAFAVAIGCFAVSVDLHNDEPQSAAIVLIVGGFLLGAIWPRGAWRTALILGLSIIVGSYFAPRLNMVATAPLPVNWGMLLALIPAFIGTYVGVAARAMLDAGGESGRR